MAYVEGFVVAVPAANKEVYRKHASEALPIFKEFGVTRMVETWGDEVPDGKVTDFKGAVKAKDLWLEKDLGTISSPYAVTMPGHGVLLLRISK